MKSTNDMFTGINSRMISSRYAWWVSTLILVMMFVPALSFGQDTANEAVRTPIVRPQLFTQFFFTRIMINTIAVILLVRYVYYPMNRKKEFYFTFFLLNFLVFVLVFLLNKSTSMGTYSAVGLLAVFTFLRLRTETIGMKDMTYLFVVLTLATINATMTGPYYELISLNVFIVLMTFSLDKEWLSRTIHVRTMELNSLDNIIPEKMDQLKSDLLTRTGLNIQRVEIDSVDLVRSRAVVRVFYCNS
ncbi:MAG: DUF4956 domain-containing protein [Cyclobacteriaceae bacterium]|nr:DUF4956 domain-containing protein [Cyclobacteriaceae bacterium]